MADGYYPQGYFTFHAEGASSSATDKLHWPKGASGVTIGPGYDLKERTELAVYADMISVGISREDANIIKKGAGKKFHEAEMFVKNYKDKIKPINKAQKIALFNMIWNRYYVPTSKRLFKKLPHEIYEKNISVINKKDSKVFWHKTDWEDLDNRIIDIIVDLLYQGTLRDDLRYASSKNDPEYFASCIEKYDDLVHYDIGRKRIPYLRRKCNGPSNF